MEIPLSRRRLLLFLVLPAIVLLLASSWYGQRAVAVLYLVQLTGMSMTSVGLWSSGATVARAVGLLFGGLLAALVAPEIATAIGAVVFAVGLLVFALTAGPLTGQALVISAFTSGLPVPGVYAAAARAFPRPLHQLRIASFFLLVVTVDLGATMGSTASGLFYERLGSALVLSSLAAPAVLAALLAAGAAIGGRILAPWPPAEPGRRLPWVALGVAVGLFLLAALPWGLASAASSGLVQGMATQLGPSLGKLIGIDSAIAIAGGLVAAVACAGAWALKWDVPAFLWVGSGFLLIAVGATVGALAIHGSTAGLVAADALGRAGETLVLAPLLSTLAGDVPWRLSGPLVGAWLAVNAVFATVGYGATLWLSQRPELPQLAVVGLAGSTGIVLLLAAIPVQRLLARADAAPATGGAVA